MAQQIPEDILFDVRLIERHIQRGLLTREAVDKRRAQCPDLTEHADNVDVDQLGQSPASTTPAIS